MGPVQSEVLVPEQYNIVNLASQYLSQLQICSLAVYTKISYLTTSKSMEYKHHSYFFVISKMLNYGIRPLDSLFYNMMLQKKLGPVKPLSAQIVVNRYRLYSGHFCGSSEMRYILDACSHDYRDEQLYKIHWTHSSLLAWGFGGQCIHLQNKLKQRQLLKV